jgi:hypothetical protein
LVSMYLVHALTLVQAVAGTHANAVFL